MGYVQAMSACAACKRLFAYNPMRVPSVRINGVREPVCRSCIDLANEKRRLRGMDPIVPLDGAYEPCNEADLDEEG